MGVITRAPVSAVPMTAPPCQINGGSPPAFWPALGLAAWQAAPAGPAPAVPLRCPVLTGVLACVTQAAVACDEVCVVASADPLATARVAAPPATSVRVARRPRRLLNALFIRVLLSCLGHMAPDAHVQLPDL